VLLLAKDGKLSGGGGGSFLLLPMLYFNDIHGSRNIGDHINE